MFLNTTKNWKKYLSLDDEVMLNEILMKAAKHRGAYKNADDVKVAQLWCSMIEMKKQMSSIDERLKRIENILGGLVQRNKEEDERLLRNLKNF